MRNRITRRINEIIKSDISNERKYYYLEQLTNFIMESYRQKVITIHEAKEYKTMIFVIKSTLFYQPYDMYSEVDVILESRERTIEELNMKFRREVE